MNKRGTGSFYEDVAVQYLTKHGVKVIERNYNCRIGEIDIIGIDGECLVFFEVKYRKNDNFGSPFEAITLSKQKRIVGCAKYYSVFKNWKGMYRFDAIGITGDKIEWIKNAFC